MTDLVATLTVLAGSVGVFIMGTRLGMSERLLGGTWLGYLVPVVFTLTALTVAAHGDEPRIWKTERGIYTDMPERYAGESKPWKPTRDRLTPMKFRQEMANWTVGATVRVVPGVERCMGVFLGNTLAAGGASICRGERAVIKRERVKRRGSITTTTDTVLTVGGREVMRIEGPRYDHRPRATRRE
jgi:hypothetical protein